MNIIKVTNNAHKILKKIYLENNKSFISFGIKSGGCGGFQYILNPCNKIPSKLDEVINMKDYKIKIENDYILTLIGTEIDYTDDIMGSRFIFNNPNSNFKCGCGKSFS